MCLLYTNESRLYSQLTAICKETNQYRVRALRTCVVSCINPYLLQLSCCAITDCSCAITDCSCAITDCSCAITDCSCAITDCSCAITDCSCAITDCSSAITDSNGGDAEEWELTCQRRKVKLGGTVHSVNCPSCNLRSDMLCALT